MDIMNNFLLSSLAMNFFLSLAAGVTMKQMWALINTLQILTHMTLLGPNMPQNLVMFLQFLMDLSNLNVFPAGLTDSIFGFVTD